MKGSDAEWTALELTLISCRHLKAFKIFQKLSVYAVVSIYNDELKKKEQRHKTAVDREGGGSPEWNDSTMHFDLKTISSSSPSSLPSHHLYLRFDLCCEGVVFGKRAIGQVCVPLKDLIKESSGTDLTRSVSYQVRSSDKRPNGVLSFSYKVHRNNTDPGDKRTDSPVVPRGIPPSGHYNQSVDHQLDVEKIQNVESPYKRRTNLYPSLHDIYITPPPITCIPGTDEVMTYPEFHHYRHQIPTQEAIGMFCVPASSVSGYGHGVYKNNYHPHPLTENNCGTAPFLQIVPETYQCRTESIGHGNGQSGPGGWAN
ncbi:hypothetical protein K2173_010062 [Erythroxylum novogranatense]|uniref:C2 domain-containing protein n=1 Tax=Erythroxylum novogranatense TaxID=1862640 RepID=A0AAV8T0K3_9ROSI|nr:hypothetical protein K2173_010062 [Erythroxylum novogranatense]